MIMLQQKLHNPLQTNPSMLPPTASCHIANGDHSTSRIRRGRGQRSQATQKEQQQQQQEEAASKRAEREREREREQSSKEGRLEQCGLKEKKKKATWILSSLVTWHPHPHTTNHPATRDEPGRTILAPPVPQLDVRPLSNTCIIPVCGHPEDNTMVQRQVSVDPHRGGGRLGPGAWSRGVLLS